MEKCNTCGLEKDQHTQLPHRFVSIPPNPDQGSYLMSGSL